MLVVLWLVLLHGFVVSNFVDMRYLVIGLTLWWLTLGLVANLVQPYLEVHNNHGANFSQTFTGTTLFQEANVTEISDVGADATG